MNWRYIKRALQIASLLIVIGAGGSFAIAQFHGNRMLSVQSGSMVPVLRKGDLVSVIRVPDTQLKVGDIVTYKSPLNTKQTITHRIVGLPSTNNKHMFVTKGDANSSADPLVPANKIIGKVNRSVPYAGYVIDFLRKPLGLALLIWIPALVIIIEEIRRLTKYYSIAPRYVSATIRDRIKSANRGFSRKISIAAKGSLLLIFVSFFVALPVYALLTSQATLTDTTISTGAITPPPQCTTNGNNTTIVINGTSGNNTNNVNVNNSNNQTANTGNATSNGGNATSGNATNTNCTNINITITNH